MKSRFRATLLVMFVAAMAVAVQPAGAIQYGQIDEGEHPFVGAMVVEHSSLGPILWCSGTLISPTVFLTAAHCDVDPDSLIGVTFVDAFDPGNIDAVPAAEFITDKYTGSVYSDYAVIILADEVDGPYASLPDAGVLDTLVPNNDASKVDRTLTAVGYGSTGLNRGTGEGYPSFVYPEVRMQASVVITNLNNALLANRLVQTTAAPGTGGGTCYGDSDGPFFLPDGETVVAITVTGYNINCGGADLNLRIDVEHVLEFLNEYI